MTLDPRPDHISPEGLARLEGTIEQAEGCRLTAYQDTLGVWTIGIGTNLQELRIDRGTAVAWLRAKVYQSERDAGTFPWYAGLTLNRQLAIIELIYNMGRPRFTGFVHMISALAAKDYPTAAAELVASAWTGQVGPTRAARLHDAILRG